MRKIIYIVLAISIIINVLLIYDHIENSRKLNIAWSNSISRLASAIVVSTIQPDILDNLGEDTLSATRFRLQILTTQLANLQSLPEGAKIVSHDTMKKVFELTNFEYNLIAKIEKDINSSKEISSNDLGQLARINKAWEKMLEALQSKGNEINPFSPIFQADQWKAVLDNATNELNGLELKPFEDSVSER